MSFLKSLFKRLGDINGASIDFVDDNGVARIICDGDKEVARFNADGTALLDPQGNDIPIIKTEIAAASASAFSVATGYTPGGSPSSATAIDISSTVLDTDGTLVDLINNYINVPTDATHFKAKINGYFAANATGNRYIALEQHIGGVMWLPLVFEDKVNAGASLPTYFSFSVPLSTISAASAPRVRFAVGQSSGGNLNCVIASLVFEFLKVT